MTDIKIEYIKGGACMKGPQVKWGGSEKEKSSTANIQEMDKCKLETKCKYKMSISTKTYCLTSIYFT